MLRDVLAEVCTAINTREVGEVKSQHICFFGGKIQCLPPNHTPTNHKVFKTFNADNWYKGFTCAEWSDLQSEIITYLKEIGEWDGPTQTKKS